MRYGYFAYEHRKISVNDTHLEFIGFAEVNSELCGHDRFSGGLRPWALNLLRDGRHEAGLFSFVYGEIVEEAIVGDSKTEIFLAWDGEQEIQPVPA